MIILTANRTLIWSILVKEILYMCILLFVGPLHMHCKVFVILFTFLFSSLPFLKFLKFALQGKNPKMRVSLYFHSSFSPISSTFGGLQHCGSLINPYLTKFQNNSSSIYVKMRRSPQLRIFPLNTYILSKISKRLTTICRNRPCYFFFFIF